MRVKVRLRVMLKAPNLTSLNPHEHWADTLPSEVVRLKRQKNQHIVIDVLICCYENKKQGDRFLFHGLSR